MVGEDIYEKGIRQKIQSRTLIAMVGLPRTGKSTWIKNYVDKNPHTPVVSKDAVWMAITGSYSKYPEEKIRNTIVTMIRSLLITGYEEVIYDATNLTKSGRDWLRKHFNVKFQEMTATIDEIDERARRSGKKSLTKRSKYLQSLIEQYEPLGTDEPKFERKFKL